MTVEAVTNLKDLNPAFPGSADPKSEGDDHIRNMKKALLEAFAGFMGAVLITGIDGGAVNAYTVNPADPVEAYGLRMLVVFSPTASNTGACTLSVSGMEAKTLRSLSGDALVAGDLVIGVPQLAIYDGTGFRLASPTKQYIDSVREYATQLAFNTALPAQAGNAGKVLTTDGANARWSQLSGNALHLNSNYGGF